MLLVDPASRTAGLFAAASAAALPAWAALATGLRGGGPPGAGFGSIDAVRALFADDWALTAGWMHYLAFDLVVGTWIARTGTAAGVPRLLILPCLALTFLAGPAGLLAYLLLRLAAGPRTGVSRTREHLA